MRSFRRAVRGLLLASCALVWACVGPPLTVLPESLPDAIENAVYSQSLTADTNDAVRWELSGGALPPGLGLSSSNGVVSGRPTVPGTYDFIVDVETRSPNRLGQRFFSIRVIEELAATLELPPARVGEAYSATPDIDGGVPPYDLRVVGLPAGLDYSRSTGEIFGTPRLEDDGVRVELLVEDDGDPQQALSVRATLEIRPVGVAITTEDLPMGAVGEEYAAQLAAMDGRAPYTWSIDAGVLPRDLRLNQLTGEITGAVTAQALTRTFTVLVRDADSPPTSDTRKLKLVVPVLVATETLAAAPAGVAYEEALAAVAGLPPYTWNLVDGELPDGLAFDADEGVISGTPEGVAQTTTFTVEVRDSDAPETADEQTLKLVVPITLVTETLPDGTVGQAYAVEVDATNGLPPYTFSVVDGVLPDGLTLAADTGAIAGTPTAAGAVTFTVRATDADEPATNVEREFTITIAEP